MSRTEYIGHYFEDADDVERYANLMVVITPGHPATLWEPAEGPEVEPIALDVEGIGEVDLREWAWLVDEILSSERIPEPPQREYEHEDYYDER